MISKLDQLEMLIPKCRKCPRIVSNLKAVKIVHPDHWCRPVPGMGDPKAKILIVGLAPGRLGANIHGRMFTGDQSGAFLFNALRKCGFVKKEDKLGPYDFNGLFITAALRCFPPENKPLKVEMDNCRPYLEKEIELLKQVKVIVALGKIGHDAVLKVMEKRMGTPLKGISFAHGKVYRFNVRPTLLIDSYHVSPQNTFTKRLTPNMFENILKKALELSK